MKDVDVRDKPGHDEKIVKSAILAPSFRGASGVCEPADLFRHSGAR
jgi:hypothetical protein